MNLLNQEVDGLVDGRPSLSSAVPDWSVVAMTNKECIIVILQCFLLSLIYIGSLYVWRNRYERDHPSTIKRRSISAMVVALLSPLYLYICISQKYLNNFTLWQLFGLRSEGVGLAVAYSLILSVILFLGPVCLQIVNGSCAMYSDSAYWRDSITDWVWVRNRIVAPLSEELTYRACMIPLLLQCFPDVTAIFVGAVFFGLAHFNHLIENLLAGGELTTSLLTAVAHFLQTSIFGAYSAFLFLRTGHLGAPLIAHMFCNHMGSPDLSEPLNYSGVKRYMFFISFLLGLILWCLLLVPLTEPSLYGNTLYWYQNFSVTKSA